MGEHSTCPYSYPNIASHCVPGSLESLGGAPPTDIVFWGKSRDLPMKKPAILKQFKAAIGRIGITEEERPARVVLFHSYRHAFNTYTRGKVPDEQLRRVMGHRSLSMSDNYDHPGAEHLADVKAAQERMFAP